MPRLRKMPSENWDYALDFADVIPAGDSLASVVSVTLVNVATGADTTADLIDSAGGHVPAISAMVVVFCIKSGVLREQHHIEVAVLTTGGRKFAGKGTLEIY